MTIVYYVNVTGPLLNRHSFRVTRSILSDCHGLRLVRIYLIYQEAPGNQLVQFMEVTLPGHTNDPVDLS
jgi:hypothetical protein